MVKLAFFEAKYGNFFDKLIAWWTRDNFFKFWKSGKYSHVEIVYSETETGWKGLSSFQGEGVRLVNFSNSTRYKWNFINVPNVDSSNLSLFYTLNHGKKYDWKAIFLTFVFPFKSQDPKKYFCSELVAKYLKENGYPLNKRPARISPNKLYKIVTTIQKS